MIPLFAREEIRKFDAAAIGRGVPSLSLMENAGRGAARVIEQHFGAADRHVLIVCGAGNNGGDGFVVGRRLQARGAAIQVVSLVPPESLKGDALTNFRAFLAVGGSVTHDASDGLESLAQELLRHDLVIDAIFGTGLTRDVTGRERRAIELVNECSLPRVALDLPSGLDCDRGIALGLAIRADLTITFAHLKRGLFTPSGKAYAGEVVCVDIGVPAEFDGSPAYEAELVEELDVARVLPRRSVMAHKASAGRVLVIAGSPGRVGAALLAAHGALRAGAGLVTIAAHPDAATTLEQRVLEAMTLRIDPEAPERSLDPVLETTDVVAIGPGLGFDELARRAIEHVVMNWDGFKVVDADALTHFKGQTARLKQAKGRAVLLPHPGEAARLLGTSATEVENDRYGSVQRLRQESNQTVLLKGAHTLIAAPNARISVNSSGTPALATGGAGDVLCGIVAALGVELEPRAAALAAAYLHGRAAELWASRHGDADRGLLAHEVADLIPDVIAGLSGVRARLTS